jgi:serine/threonine-protein kinase
MEGASLVGKTFSDRYELLELVGQGGMGAVYRAIDKQMSDRIVAVKVLAPALVSDEKQVLRFEQEARAASRLRHPNTISVLDFGRSDEGHIFMVIEFLTGETLTATLRRGRLEPSRAVYIMRQVCKSLAEAHALNIVHRDLKPDNIFVCEIYGEKDFVKVIDFGIAKFIEDEHAELTQAGKMFGTPRYLSPEQAQGLKLDNRSDLYSLGVILFEMLTGKPPFVADEPIAVAIKHVQAQPPRLADVRDDLALPEAFEALVARLLEKQPEARFQAAEEVVVALDEAVGSLGAVDAQNFTPVAARTPARPVTVPPPNRPAEPDATLALDTVAGGGDDEDATRALDTVQAGPDADATMALDTLQAGATPANAAAAEQRTMALDTAAAGASVAAGTPGRRAGREPEATSTTPAVADRHGASTRNLLLLLIATVLVVGAVVVMKLGGGEPAERPTSVHAQPTMHSGGPGRPTPAMGGAAAAVGGGDKAGDPAAGDTAAADDGGARALPGAATPVAERVEQHVVEVRSKPAGAQVILGGMPLGNTPYKMTLRIDDPPRKLVLKHEGYKDYELRIDSRTVVEARLPAVTAAMTEAAAEKKVDKGPPPKKKERDWSL